MHSNGSQTRLQADVYVDVVGEELFTKVVVVVETCALGSVNKRENWIANR